MRLIERMMNRVYTLGSWTFKDENPYTEIPSIHRFGNKMHEDDRDVPSSDAETEVEEYAEDPLEAPTQRRNQYSIDSRNLVINETENPLVCTICWGEALPSKMTLCSDCGIFARHIDCGEEEEDSKEPKESKDPKRKKTERKWICSVCLPKRQPESHIASPETETYQKMTKDIHGFMVRISSKL